MATTLFRPGATALITGGAGGVGFAFASMCRRHGMNVCILDYNKTSLKAAEDALSSDESSSSSDLKTESHYLDVGDLKAWQTLKPQILSSFPQIDILMLNAGTSVKPTTSSPYEDPTYFHKTLDTNMYGVIHGLATFLPEVRSAAKPHPSDRSAVIITGSKQGVTNPPGANNPAYNMSKAALRCLAEHLAHDLRTPSNPSYAPNVAVHLLMPGWTYTGLSGNVGPTPDKATLAKKPDGAWLPDQVAEYAEKKLEEGVFCIPVPDGDVDLALDQARMTWTMADLTEERSALSRWDDKYKEEAAKWIAEEAERRRNKK